jgi:hypothetical protein
MALYGHPQAGFAWARELHNSLLNRDLRDNALPCPLSIKQCVSQPVIFYVDFSGTKYNNELMIIHIHNDNQRIYLTRGAAPCYQRYLEWFGNRFEITGGEHRLQDMPPHACLGMVITYGDGWVSHKMEAYIRKYLQDHGMSNCNPVRTPMSTNFTITPEELPKTDEERNELIGKVNTLFHEDFQTYQDVITKYRSIVSGAGWIAVMVGNVVSLAVSILGRCMHNPTYLAFQQCKRLLRYLRGHIDLGPTWYKTNDPITLYMASDASFADCDITKGSQGGWLGGLTNRAPTTYSSTRSDRVCLNTYEAEITHASLAMREIEYLHNWTSEIYGLIRQDRLDHSEPHDFMVDNASLALSATALIRKWSPRSKQFTVESRYILQGVEDRIVRARQVPGNKFAADAMTKPLPEAGLEQYFPEMQGAPP